MEPMGQRIKDNVIARSVSQVAALGTKFLSTIAGLFVCALSRRFEQRAVGYISQGNRLKTCCY